MDLSQQRFDQLVGRIYDTLEDRGAWRAVLEDLNQALQGRAVHMFAFDNKHGALSFSDGADMAAHIDLEYIQRFQYIDPRVGLMMSTGMRGWMHCHEHFDDEFAATHPFYQEFLLPNDGRYASAIKLQEDESASILIAFIRSAAHGPLPAEAVQFIDRLRPHLERATRIGLHHFVYSAQALVGHALINKLRQPVMLLTTNAEVIQSNDAARRLLTDTALLAVRNGRLVLPEPFQQHLQSRLRKLEAQARATPDAPNDDAGFQALHITSAPPQPADALYAFHTLLAPDRVMGTFGLRPLVMVCFYHPQSTQEIDPALLSAAFGLSNAEARIANLLADGMTLRDIAIALGVQYETVRKQLQSIYQKTSTNRQPELVRLLLNLPPATIQHALERTRGPDLQPLTSQA